MHFTEGSVEHELRQTRLSRFGRVLGGVSLGYVGLVTFTSIYVDQPAFNRSSIPLLVAAAAFAALWLLLRGAPRSPRFVRAVELSTLFVGTTAFSTMALILDLTASPDMVVRSVLTYMLLVYAVYVPSTARHTLVIAALMTVPLLGCIFVAFSSWDPASCVRAAPACGARRPMRAPPSSPSRASRNDRASARGPCIHRNLSNVFRVL